MWSQLNLEIRPDVVQILKKKSSMSYPCSSNPWSWVTAQGESKMTHTAVEG